MGWGLSSRTVGCLYGGGLGFVCLCSSSSNVDVDLRVDCLCGVGGLRCDRRRHALGRLCSLDCRLYFSNPPVHALERSNLGNLISRGVDICDWSGPDVGVCSASPSVSALVSEIDLLPTGRDHVDWIKHGSVSISGIALQSIDVLFLYLEQEPKTVG